MSFREGDFGGNSPVPRDGEDRRATSRRWAGSVRRALAPARFRPRHAPPTALERSIRRDRIWEIVARIPPGKVSTYGEIARAAGIPRGARQVGRALRACPAQLGLPWHRVLAAGGRIALPGDRGQEQRLRLEYENVPFAGSRVRLDLCRWEAPEA